AVPHGAALGTRTLKVAAAGGIFMAADVVEVTAITVGPSGVDSNPGSAAAPFKTLKTAILTAGGGDTIHLLDGTYNAASGETWGYVIPDNLTIVGDSTEATILDGAGAASNLNGFDASAALTLKSLTVQHFTIGIDVKKPSSMLTLQDVVLASHSYYGISVESTAMGSTVTMSGAKGLITQPGHQAIYVASVPNTTINLTDGKLQGGSYVIQISGNCSGSKLNVSGTTIEQLTPNAYSAIYTSISSNPAGTEFTFDKTTFIGSIDYDDPKGSVTITGSMIQPKAGYGVNFAGKTLSITGTTISMMMNNYPGIYYHSAMLGTMSLKNVTVDGGNYNIQQNAPGSTSKMRGTTLKNSQSDGYYLQAGDLDLGTAAESGDNIFGSPVAAGGYCLYISRGGGMNGGGPVTCSGTAFGATGPNDGQRPSAADSVDASGGAVTKAPQLYYVGAGDKLTFF
ncbi:MAG TPA: DUF1565 domain-containing protein, partial [Polyangia bacterium]|nr:DUF1565 domain-containing protein [Polyangia bacterium]